MQMPDLVARLAALHATLTTRAGMQDRLLALSGRLELVLAQAALRGAPVSGNAKAQKDDPNKAATQYIEGQSDEEPIEEDDDSDAGSEEVVELGDDEEEDDDELPSGSGEEEDEDEDDEDDEDEDDEEDESGSDTGARRMNGLVDDEAEEDWDDESESDEE